MNRTQKKPKILDLFCGSGGLSLGFEKAGFEVGMANDIDKSSILTYKKNHPHVSPGNIVCGDIKEFLKEQKNVLKRGSFQVVMGGPPCQGFSMANRQRLINDPRNILYKDFVEVIEMVRPDVLLMENVKGMLTVAEQVVEDFKKLDYSVMYKVYNAKEFGVPQHRERLIYIGVNNECFAHPTKALSGVFSSIEDQKRQEIPLKDAFWGLRALVARKVKNDTSIEDEDSGFNADSVVANRPAPSYIRHINSNHLPTRIYNHKARYNNDRDLEIFRLLPPGMDSSHPSIQHIMPYKSRSHIFKDKYYKLNPNKVSKTITSHMKFDCNMYIHPFEARGITPREAARLQSFPDDYIFEGPYTQWYAQIGNAVPPLLGGAIGLSIMKILV